MNSLRNRRLVEVSRLLLTAAAAAFGTVSAQDIAAPDATGYVPTPHTVPAGQDLTFVPDSVTVNRVFLHPTANDANLRELLAYDVRVFLLDRGLRGAVSVLVPSPPPGTGTGTASVMPPCPHDLIVRLVLAAPEPPPSDAGTACALRIQNQWYARSATVLDPSQPCGPAPAPAIATMDPVAHTVVHIGVVLTAADTIVPHWRLSGRIARRVHEPAPPLADFTVLPWQPVIVLFTFADETGTEYACRDLASSNATAAGRALAFTACRNTAVSLTGKAVVDPDNLIPEWDETNNTAQFLWGQWPPPRPEQDLYPVSEKLANCVVGCTATARDPILQSVLRHRAGHALAAADGFLAVHLFPWHQAVAGLDTLLPVPEQFEFDLVLLALFAVPGPDPAAIDRLVVALNSEWAVATAVAKPPPCMDWINRLNTSPYACCQSVVPVFLRLERTKETRRYWRVTVPVVRRAWNASEPFFPATPTPAGSWYDLITQYGTGFATGTPTTADSAQPVPRWEPILVDVEAAATCATAAGTMTASRGWDHVWLAPNQIRDACVFLELGETPLQAGAVTVDPHDRIPETDETNNRCHFFHAPEPMPEPRFDATAQILAPARPGSEEPSEQLVVRARLRNPAPVPIVLRFPSSLQLDFRLGHFYQWSDDKLFTTALTTVVVAPGDAAVWTLNASMHDLGWDGTQTLLEVFLSGTGYRDVLRFPPPAPWPYTAPYPDLDGIPDTQDTATLIVAPQGLDLERVLEENASSAVPVLAHLPLEGNLETGDRSWRYRARNGFQGTDFIVLGNALDPTCGTARCLSIGLQTFRFVLQSGWNLVSFPIRPLLDADELLARIPGATAWVFRNDAYQPLEQIEAGEAVWISCTRATELEFLGEPMPDRLRRLRRGWNLTATVNDHILAGMPGVRRLRAWSGSDYCDRNTTRSGEGVWVYVERDLNLPLY